MRYMSEIESYHFFKAERVGTTQNQKIYMVFNSNNDLTKL